MDRLLAILLALQPVEGGITFYYGEPFEGTPLKCPGYSYEWETGPWIGLDITWFEEGRVQCGDWFLVTFYDGSTMLARALESGHLDYRIWPKSKAAWDSELPFVADLPRYWRDGRETRTGTIWNVSAYLRTMREHGQDRRAQRVSPAQRPLHR